MATSLISLPQQTTSLTSLHQLATSLTWFKPAGDITHTSHELAGDITHIYNTSWRHHSSGGITQPGCLSLSLVLEIASKPDLDFMHMSIHTRPGILRGTKQSLQITLSVRPYSVCPKWQLARWAPRATCLSKLSPSFNVSMNIYLSIMCLIICPLSV